MRMRYISVVAAVGLGAVLALPAMPASGKTAPNFKALTNTINKAKKMTYYAQYASYSGSAQQTTVTIAQAPPKSNFSSASGSVINNGKTTYYCGTAGSAGNSGTTGNTGNSANSGSSGNSGSTGNSGSSGNSGSTGNSGSSTTTAKSTVTCVASKGSNPLLGLESFFSPTAALTLFSEAKDAAVARALGIKVSSSSATFAGQPSTCLSATVKGKSSKYCVTKQGILSYAGSSTSSSYFKLTKYSSKPPASLFAVPAGATITTLPGGASLP
jgi:hypothetical protein